MAPNSRDRLHCLLTDVTKEDQIAEAVKKVESIVEKNRLDMVALVNNAAMAAFGPLECIPVDHLRYQYDVNVFGVFAMTKAFLPLMRKATANNLKSGNPPCLYARVLNISSMLGFFTLPTIGAYCSTKWAMQSLTDAWRVELKRWDIGCVTVNPGEVNTPFHDTTDEIAKDLQAKMSSEQKELYSTYIDRSSKPRVVRGVTAELVADAIAQTIEMRCPPTSRMVTLTITDWIAAFFLAFIPQYAIDKIMGKIMPV